MHNYEAKELDLPGIRTFPWQTSFFDQSCRYYDFKAKPELIPQVLEDFLPWSHYPAIQDFYSYLAWLNGSESELESDDCSFRAADENLSPNISSCSLQSSGRLMLFYRRYTLNCDPRWAKSLGECFSFYLERTEIGFSPSLGVIGLSKASTAFIPIKQQQGRSLVINFWAWGNTDTEVMDNLQRVFRALRQASEQVSKEIREAVEHG